MAPIRRSTRLLPATLALSVTLALGTSSGAPAGILPGLKARAPRTETTRDAGIPTDAELEAWGARIGAIHFNSRELFDVEGRAHSSAFARLGNRLHFQTRIGTLEDLLLFRSGDPYRAHLIEESARILRDTRYLREPSIRPVSFHDGLVDIEVATQEVWTFSPKISFGRKGGSNTGGLGFEELNFLGTGTHVGAGFKSGVDRDSRYLKFDNRQLGSTWWALSTNYSDNSDGRLAEIVLEQPFYCLGSLRAGGLSLLDDVRIDARYDDGEVIDRFATHEKRGTLYLGRSSGLVGGWSRRVTVGLTFEEQAFGAAPGFAAPRLLPDDRKLVYPWIGTEWVEDAFETGRNRDQIEMTEDYSVGWRLYGVAGIAAPALGSDRDALILSAGAFKGLPLSQRQSVSFDANVAGRLESGVLADGLLQATARYYFRQSERRLFFMRLDAAASSNPDRERQILLGGDNGLRGYPLRYQGGAGSWLFTAEQRFFTDWYPLRLFNVGGAVFYDMGATWGRDPLGSPSQGVLRDFGFGLRLGNSRSARGNVLHLDVAFPLDGSSGMRRVQYLIETKKSF